MPESPEVRILKGNLNDTIKGLSIVGITFLTGCRYHRHGRPKKYKGFNKQLAKCKGYIDIINIHVKGKFMWWELEHDWSIWWTMGMSGKFSYTEERNSAICIDIFNKSNPERSFKIYFVDQRHFGTVRFCSCINDLEYKLQTIGPDIGGSEITVVDFLIALRKHERMGLAVALMKQGIISGIGNYMRAEGLYRAKLYPFNKIREYTNYQLETLYYSLRAVFRKSIKDGGVSIQHFTSLDGVEGKYADSLLVYNCDFDPNGHPVKKVKTSDARTLHWVPEIQIED